MTEKIQVVKPHIVPNKIAKKKKPKVSELMENNPDLKTAMDIERYKDPLLVYQKEKIILNRVIATKLKYLDELRNAMGIIRYACQKTGISRDTQWNWYHTDGEFRKRHDSISEEVYDFVETKILDAIRNDDTTMTIFYAKTKMKHRGYVERHEITGQDGLEIIIREI
jgi:hypothetical protein